MTNGEFFEGHITKLIEAISKMSFGLPPFGGIGALF